MSASKQGFYIFQQFIVDALFAQGQIRQTTGQAGTGARQPLNQAAEKPALLLGGLGFVLLALGGFGFTETKHHSIGRIA